MGKVTHTHTHLKVRGLDCNVEGVQWGWRSHAVEGNSQSEQAVWWGMGSVMEALWFKERKDMGCCEAH